MKPEEFVNELRQAPVDLVSVILYGSAASGDYLANASDFNLLVLLRTIRHSELDAIRPVCAKWNRAGNPLPRLFTPERLAQSADVFPLELLDIKANHRILFGEDPLSAIAVSQTHLRHELEYELRSNLIRLHQAYLNTAGRPKAVAEMMVSSLSSILALCRGSLRLFATSVPPDKMEALKALAPHVGCRLEVFETLQQIKTGARNAKDQDIGVLYDQYLEEIGRVIAGVDRFLTNSNAN